MSDKQSISSAFLNAFFSTFGKPYLSSLHAIATGTGAASQTHRAILEAMTSVDDGYKSLFNSYAAELRASNGVISHQVSAIEPKLVKGILLAIAKRPG